MDIQDVRTSRRGFLNASAVTVLGIGGAALVGCGAADSDADAATAAAESGTRAATRAPSAATASGVPDEFIVANEAEPPDLLPWFTGFGGGLVTRQVYQTMWEPRLTLVDGEPSWENVPVLAQDFEQVEPAVWRIHLREGVTFHNGEPWNADAAVASFDLLSNPDVIAELKKLAILSAITRFEKVDEMTVEVEARTPGFDGIATAFRIGYSGLPAQAIAGEGWRSFAEQPIGTGPIRITGFNRGVDVQGEAFEGYWGRPFPIPRVRWITRPEASVRALTVRTGEAHFAFNIGAEPALQLDHSVVGGGFQTNMIRLNNTRPPFDDLRLRLAANYAIDREAIAEQIFHGTAQPTNFFAYAPSNAEPVQYDPEQARALLAEAGAEGVEVEMIYGEMRLPEETALAEIFKGYLDAVGFRTTITRVERAAYGEVSGAEPAQQPQMLMESTSSGNYGEVMSSLDDKFGCEGSGTYCNPELEALWNALRGSDLETRDREVAEIARRLQDDAPRVWIAAVNQVHGIAPFVDTSGLPANLYILFDDLNFA